jgi:hypothetical protein
MDFSPLKGGKGGGELSNRRKTIKNIKKRNNK